LAGHVIHPELKPLEADTSCPGGHVEHDSEYPFEEYSPAGHWVHPKVPKVTEFVATLNTFWVPLT